jgi:uncharacterized membrane protein
LQSDPTATDHSESVSQNVVQQLEAKVLSLEKEKQELLEKYETLLKEKSNEQQHNNKQVTVSPSYNKID